MNMTLHALIPAIIEAAQVARDVELRVATGHASIATYDAAVERLNALLRRAGMTTLFPACMTGTKTQGQATEPASPLL